MLYSFYFKNEKISVTKQFFYNKEDRRIKISLGEEYGLLFMKRKELNEEILCRHEHNVN